MPHIIVVADCRRDPGDGEVMLRERITASDLESRHFASHLLERLEWAVGDAHEAEQAEPKASEEPGGREVQSSSEPSNSEPQRSDRVLITAS